MKKGNHNEIIIKRSHIFYTIIVIVLFFLGIFIGNFILSKQSSPNTVENCKKFCGFIPDTEFSHIGSDNHCYCVQRERLIDSLLNKSMVYTKIVDAGIITDVEIGNIPT
jgi:hypothetical protein